MSEVYYWMFVNAFLVLLDIEAVFLLGLHLWLKRRAFKLVHMVSLAFMVFLLGQVIFRTLYWELWHQIADPNDLRTIGSKLLMLFHIPIIKLASVLNMTGLIMIIAVLTWEIKFLWVWLAGVAFISAALSVWLV